MKEVHDEGSQRRHGHRALRSHILRAGMMHRAAIRATSMAAVLCLITALLSCTTAPSPRVATLAVVDGRPISADAFLHELRTELSQRGWRADAVDGSFSGLVSEVQHRMIDDELVLAELERRGEMVTNAEVLAAVASRAKQFRSEVEFQAHVDAHFGGRLAFHADTRRAVRRQRLLELAAPAPQIDETVARQYYDDHLDEFTTEGPAKQAGSAPSTRAFEEVSHEIRASLSRREQYAGWRAVLERLRAEARIEIQGAPLVAPAAEVRS